MPNTEMTQLNSKGKYIVPTQYNQKATDELMNVMGRNIRLVESDNLPRESVIKCREIIADLIINQNADPNALVYGVPNTRVSHFLAAMGASDLITSIKEHKPEFDLNIQNVHEQTALHVALGSRYNYSINRADDHMDKLVSALANGGVDGTIKNYDGRTAMEALVNHYEYIHKPKRPDLESYDVEQGIMDTRLGSTYKAVREHIEHNPVKPPVKPVEKGFFEEVGEELRNMAKELFGHNTEAATSPALLATNQQRGRAAEQNTPG